MNTVVKQEVATIVPQQTALTPMDLLNQAVGSGNLDLAEKLMGLQERWEKNQARKDFDEAIAAAKADIPPIARNRTGHNSKRYADFEAIARVIDPILPKHGLHYRFRTKQTEGRIEVTCVLGHKSGHYEETTLCGPADKTGNKNEIQAIGSTLTYLQRYSLVQMLGLAVSDDDDAAAAIDGSAISEDQASELQSLIVEVAADIPRFCKYMKVERIEDIRAAEFNRAKSALEAKRVKE